MTRFPKSIAIDGAPVRLDARPSTRPADGEPSWTIEIGSRSLDVHAGCLADGGFWFLDPDGRRHHAYVAPTDHGIYVRVDGVTWLLESAERDYGAGDEDEGDPTLVSAPMTGTVVKILCAVGDLVEKDQDLAVLSAMKMEHRLQAAQNGRVASIEVKSGATVDAGSLIVRLEASEDSGA